VKCRSSHDGQQRATAGEQRRQTVSQFQQHGNQENIGNLAGRAAARITIVVFSSVWRRRERCEVRYVMCMGRGGRNGRQRRAQLLPRQWELRRPMRGCRAKIKLIRTSQDQNFSNLYPSTLKYLDFIHLYHLASIIFSKSK
jgi:hypothetical protein